MDMTPEEFVRDCTAGRMPEDRARWILDQSPELRAQLEGLISTLSRAFYGMVERAGQQLVEDVEDFVRRD